MLKYHIQTIEAGSGGTASFVFSNIPSSYTDLYILLSLRTNRNATYDDFRIVLNSTNGTSRILYGDGTNRGAFTQPTILTSGGAAGNNTTANTFGNSSVYISDYASTTRFKAISMDGVQEHNATTAYQSINAGFWSSTAAVTEVTVLPGDGTLLLQYSSASLYGIKRGSDGKTEVASGGTITTSGGYTIHTFNSSGTFVANRDLQAEVLVVAGGGGGGGTRWNLSSRNPGAGGGAGGYLEGTLNFSANTSNSVIVGAGGTGQTGGSPSIGGTTATQGSNSIVLNAVAIGGGGGGNGDTSSGGAGGSSGGSSGGAAVTAASQSNSGGLTAFSNSGGTDTANTTYGGGGGGAGGAGGITVGGAAKTSSISGSSQSYSGGGGGGRYNNAGGTGLGGTNAGNGGSTANVSGTNATANFGGGGGGSGSSPSTSTSNVGGNGGSGVVIIRYLTPAS